MLKKTEKSSKTSFLLQWEPDIWLFSLNNSFFCPLIIDIPVVQIHFWMNSIVTLIHFIHTVWRVLSYVPISSRTQLTAVNTSLIIVHACTNLPYHLWFLKMSLFSNTSVKLKLNSLTCLIMFDSNHLWQQYKHNLVIIINRWSLVLYIFLGWFKN